MPNTILTPNVIANEALMVLKNNLVMANLVHRDYENEFVKVGDTVTARRPSKFVAKNFTGAVDPQDLKAMKQTVDAAVAALNEGKHPAIVTRRPCLLIKRVKHDTGMCVVNADKCKSCKSCLKVGCPAISMENGKAFIDRTQCVGCTVCAQACPFDAIEKEEK